MRINEHKNFDLIENIYIVKNLAQVCAIGDYVRRVTKMLLFFPKVAKCDNMLEIVPKYE